MTQNPLHDEALGREQVARTTFDKEAIWLPLLGVQHLNAGETVIRGKTFTDCVIQGPAVIAAMGGVSLEGCNMGVTSNARSLMLRPLGDHIIGAIGLVDCRFVRCKFVQVGFTGPEAVLDELSASLTGLSAERTGA
ncbi:hypothetical protein [Brevundimonas sp.]|jgi:hypothetical protein|uniref:hypothetical protein n=1 Tax=Brevundimonas sp. TaxID=1871086 RepID=UPI003784BA00